MQSESLQGEKKIENDICQYKNNKKCTREGRTALRDIKRLHSGNCRFEIAVTGRIQTGSYTNRDGQKVYTTDVAIEAQEFAESKKAAGEQAENAGNTDAGDGFMNTPDEIDGDMPFM